MSNNLKQMEKDLRALAKRCKDVKYSRSLLLTFLLTGMLSFSAGLTSSELENTENSINSAKKDLNSSINDMKIMFRQAKRDNNRLLKNANLELIQLMEQGDQVIKSPWSSWQFGMNYFYNNWSGTYKGLGDKQEKYPYEGIYSRSNWKVRNAMDMVQNKSTGGGPLTPGNDPLGSWQNISNSSGGISIDRDNSISSSTNGNRSWGLVDLRNLKEPTSEVEILARISPKEVTKQAITLNITQPAINELEAPIVNPQVNKPLDAPVITLPEVEKVEISALNITAPSAPTAPTAPGAPVINISITPPNAPNALTAPSAPSVPNISVTPSAPSVLTAPNININVTAPSINALTIATPPTVVAPQVVSPQIKPVDFVIDPSGDAKNGYIMRSQAWNYLGAIPTTLNVTENHNGNFVTINNGVGNVFTVPRTQTINVTKGNNRALVVDEVNQTRTIRSEATINLQAVKNVGIDLQGGHSGSATAPTIATVVNAGTITGLATDPSTGTANKEHIAFGFNNADASNNTTMTHMINENKIELNAPSSAGIQLKPEDPNNWQPGSWGVTPLRIVSRDPKSERAKVLMKADNTGTVNLNGSKSFGILTVFNAGVPASLMAPGANYNANNHNLKAERNMAGVRYLPGGELGRSALAGDANKKYISGIYNTGSINILGDESIAVGLLQEIQEVILEGNINIGNQASLTQGSNANSKTKTDKVEEAVGVFAGVPTRPVKVNEIDSMGNRNTSGDVVGTKTVELHKNITLGAVAENSIGALVGDTSVDLNDGKLNGTQTTGRKLNRSGDITAKSGSTITVGGIKNYGFVVNNSAHSSEFGATLDDLRYSVDKVNHGRGINEGTINVTGNESVGFALIKGGNSSNSGTISVKDNAENSIGFYGKEDTFANTGTIQVTSTKKKNKAIVLDGQTAANKINFTNTGNIYVNVGENGNTNLIGTENIGIYAQGNYKFDHNGGTVKAGSNAIAFYVKDATGEVNVKAPIVLSDSGTGANAGTTIGIYSDGNAKVKFNSTKLTIGERAVGLYSSDGTKFNNTFEINAGKTLEVVLGKNSTFGLLKGNATSPLLSKYLNNNSSNKINITTFGEGASIFYATDTGKAVLDSDYTVTNGGAASTSVLVGTNGSTVEVAAGKTLTTNTNVGLIATKGSGTASTALNSGNIVSNRDNGIGIYTEGSTGTNKGTVTMKNQASVAILGENNSTLLNDTTGKIVLEKGQSAGIYGSNSNITNKGATSPNTGIYVQDSGLAGIYGLLSGNADKTLSNEGLIKLEGSANSGSAGIYAKLTSTSNKLTTNNSGTIEVVQTSSTGIYAENASAQNNTKSEVNNSGFIKVSGANSVGITGKKSKITNSGTGANKGIELSANGSAGILASDNSEAINSGRIESTAGTGLVGISVDETSTANNSGTITMGTVSSTGISSAGGAVTNSGIVTLAKESSTGISVKNGNITNTSTGNIEVKDKNSVGIYADLTDGSTQNVNNAGTISLLTPTGAPEKSAAIYSLYSSTATGILNTTNTGTVDVDQKGSVGIFAKNASTQDKTKSNAVNSKIINVKKEGSAGMLGEKSTLKNTATAANEGIILSAIKTAGMIGNAKSDVINSGNIETKTATPANANEGLVGISLDDSTGVNETTGKITLGTDFSTGMYGKNSSSLTNKGNITGNNKNAVGMAAENSTAVNETSGTVTLNGAESTGIFGKTSQELRNKGNIIGNAEKAVGIAGESSKIYNDNGAAITLKGKTSTGIFGKVNSTVTNAGKIETTTATPANAGEGLTGISLNASTATNTSTGQIILGTEYSTGIFGEAASTLTNEGSITGSKAYAVGMAGKASTVTNKNIITLDKANSTGIFGQDNSTLLNDTNGTITLREDSSVGIYSKSNSATAKNLGTIVMEKKSSAGMLGDEAELENSNSITTKDEKSAGMFAKNTNAINKKNITVNGKESAGILIQLDGKDKVLSGVNDASTGTININNELSAGMLGKITSASGPSTNSKVTLENKNNIIVTAKKSVGMMVDNDSTAVTKGNVKAENTGTITLTAGTNNEENIGILANKNATGVNKGAINVNSKKSVGMLGQAASDVTNEKTVTVANEESIGMLAKGANSSATNKDLINVTANKSLGMMAESGVGIFVRDNGTGTGTGENTSTGIINLKNKNAVGIFAKNNGTGNSAKNSGIINLAGAAGQNYESLIGMFAQAEAGKNANVENANIINVNTNKSVGMYAKNDAANTESAVILNNQNGTININSAGAAGIYAPKATVSKVGTVNLKDSVDTNGSSAVYVSEGGKVADTDSAVINLGTVNQNRVAYYVNGANSSLAGTNIGKVSGYGVGVYLQGNSASDIATLTATTPELNYKNNGLSGNGIIGLLLKGNTDISNYTKKITVGNTVDKNAAILGDKAKYAIGVYADGQGTSAATPYEIKADITTGKNGVGIFADEDSHIKYSGNMKIGDGTTAGTGIFITKKKGATGGSVTLTSNTIELLGTGGVAVIASEGTTINGGTATIKLVGTNIKGVGVYGKKGSNINVGSWNFENNGNQAEEIRSEEGGVYIDNNKAINPRIVLTHVINGETSVSSGVTVTAQDDGAITAQENIGLMAEGNKNPVSPLAAGWRHTDLEIVNQGTIDFSNSAKSTAIFAESARVKNDGTVKIGENSTGIYGVYKSSTKSYDGAPSGFKNKLEITTTGNSKIYLGNNSTGMYLVNADTVNNLSGATIESVAGATKNTGIYAVNDTTEDKKLNMDNKTNITLGDGSVGIYSKGRGTATADRNVVTNTGDVTVGKKIVDTSVTPNKEYPSVAFYAENTNLDTNSNITVGQEGIAFYGKHSDIVARGTANISNKGVLAYLENSKFVSHLGNLSATQNTMLYLRNSIAQLDGAGTTVDMDVADGYTGAYIEGNSQLTGVKNITLGRGSTGLFLKDANFTSQADKIVGTQEDSKGILSVNSNLTNNSKIELSGDNSIGIYSNADNTKSVINNGELTVSGKKTLGVFLKGGQSFENNANINIGDSANATEPTIGIFTTEGTSNIKHNAGTIEVGEKSIGIYSATNSNVEINAGKIHVKDQGIGIYKQEGKVVLKGELEIDPHIATAVNSEPTGVYGVNGAEINDQASKIIIGEKSYGFILNNTDPTKTNVYSNTNSGPVTMGNNSVFLYSNGKAVINNNRDLNSNGSEHLIGFYIKNGGDFTNNGTIDFSTGKGNIGIYAPGGTATNKGRVLVGLTDDIDPLTGKVYTDPTKIVYGIGMAADNGGHLINDGEVRVYGNKSIGLFGSGVGTIVENTANGRILLDGSRATATDKIQAMTGVYVDEGATFRNYGTVQTTDSYAGRDGKVNPNVSGLAGVAVMNGSTLENHGKILIDADNSYGVVIRGKRAADGTVEKYAVIKNYGEIKVRGKGTTGISWKNVSRADIEELERQINSRLSSDPSGQELRQAGGTDKSFEDVTITVKDGKPTFSRNGVKVSEDEIEEIDKILGTQSNLGLSDIGFYIDTLGRTKPIDIDGATPPINSQLIIGTEYSEKTNKKQWFVKEDVIKPFLDQIQGRNFKLTSLAGSLTWVATPVLDNHGQIKGVAMAKLAYTSFVRTTDNAYNFTDGLEQRYDMNTLDSAEKRIFNKLNGIGKNEETLLTQAFDEMMGHQYANVQQRTASTGRALDKEITHLRKEWDNKTKNSNKIKVFGMKDEYNTDTAGIIDYTSNAYGVAYVHENETIKLGNSSGWYAGAVNNTFKFKDIGRSKENTTMLKLGAFKSTAFDHNGSLNWTVSGEGYIARSDMHRKFLVVDEIFNAKSSYNTYGAAIKNEISKEFRTGEKFSIRPYGSLKLEYGRFNTIKEKDGEMRLEIKGNDYYSVKPEVGIEFKYKQPMAVKTMFTTTLGLGYENELGKVGDTKNKGRVAYTDADWFDIRGEKDDRKGNFKADLNIGIENQRFGVTLNGGYDTKGKNIRGGLGIRVIY